MNDVKKEVYTFSNETGDAVMTVYTVFPGIQVAYVAVHMDHFDFAMRQGEKLRWTSGMQKEKKLIEIHHCREGRIEQEFENELFYLMPGDLSVAIRGQNIKAFDFPLCHYHGITIGIDADEAPESLAQFLTGVNVQPMEVARKLCQGNRCFIIRSESYIKHIFSELYSVPEHIMAGYLRVKIMELFLILNELKPMESQIITHALPKAQAVLAKQAAAYLSGHMNQHITIAELAQKFNVSDTYLKNAFKGVYGVPVFSYMRIQKMQSAAQLLIHTDRPVEDIAFEFGYNNASKFTVAFRDVMGDTPSVYRKAHTKHLGNPLKASSGVGA